MSTADPKATWAEWSIHVLKELERLNDNYEDLASNQKQMEQRLVVLASTSANLNDIRTMLQTQLQPIQKQLNDTDVLTNTIRQTLYGVKDNNGMFGDVKDLKDEVKKINNLKYKLVGGFIVIQSLLVFFGTKIANAIWGMPK
jgi:chromosome segregation ATPase